MSRFRSEQPPDPDPGIRGGEIAAADERSKRTRKRKPRPEDEERSEPDGSAGDSSSESEDDSESGHSPESGPPVAEAVRRELAAEAAARERVELRELANRLPPETYRAVERALAATPLTWRLEKGRYLLKYLVGERSAPVRDRPVTVEQRLTISREEPPAEPEETDRHIREAVRPDADLVVNLERLERVRAGLVPGDEVRVSLPGQPEILITAESVEVAAGPEERPVTGRANESADDSRRLEPGPTVDPGRVAEIVADAERELAAAASAERVVGDSSEPTEEDSSGPAGEMPGRPEEIEGSGSPGPDSRFESPEASGVGLVAEGRGLEERLESESDTMPACSESARVESSPEGGRERTERVADVLALLDREGVRINDLPPIRGGAGDGESGDGPASEEPEPEEGCRSRQGPPESEEVPEAPESEERPPFTDPSPERDRERPRTRPRRRSRPEVLTWEPGWAEPVRLPDYGMRKSARKMVRQLAAEYGLKLTPDLEVYLMAILLQASRVNGRRVYSLGRNVGRLIGVIQVLKYQGYDIYHRPIT